MKGIYRLVLLFVLASSAFTACGTKDHKTNSDGSFVWENPAIDRKSQHQWWQPNLTVRKVEMDGKETRVYLSVYPYNKGECFIQKETSLRAEGVSFQVLRIEPNYWVSLPPGKDNVERVLHFPPLPANTVRFDLIESDDPGSNNIYGIHDSSIPTTDLYPSHWRNEKTGDWILSLYPDFAIFNCKIWQYKSQPASTDMDGCHNFVLINENKEMKVRTGRMKGLVRSFKIDGKRYKCSQITTDRLPFYPHKDKITQIKNNGYAVGDSVTVSGLLLNMSKPETSCEVCYYNMYTDQLDYFKGSIMEDGFFTVRFPVQNSVYGIVSFSGHRAGMLFEPDETYFYIYDHNNSLELFMGDNSRIQNEYLHIMWLQVDAKRIEDTNIGNDSTDLYFDYIRYKEECRKHLLDSIVLEHPNLSERTLKLYDENTKYDLANIALSPTFLKDYDMPDSLGRFIDEEYWKKAAEPYFLPILDFNYFLHNYIFEAKIRFCRNTSHDSSLITLADNAIKDGLLSFSEKEMEKYDRYCKIIESAKLEVASISDLKSKEEYIARVNNENGEIFADIAKMFNRQDSQGALEVEECKDNFEITQNTLDSLGCPPVLRDICLARELCEHLSRKRVPLNRLLLETMEKGIVSQNIKDGVYALDKKIRKYADMDKIQMKNKVPAEDLANLSEGESIMRKILEPLRGKIVYLDIWASWCKPCLENLSHSDDLKKQLTSYDIIYLYLAKGTPESTWKSLISEFGLTGDDCVHYNLSSEQQKAVESWLQVSGYPTYKLFNRNGALLDVNASPRDINSLKGILEQL